MNRINRTSLIGTLVTIALFISCFAIFATSVRAADDNTILLTSTPTPKPTPDPLIADNAFVSDLSYNKVVFNCNLPEILNGKCFSIIYEYWTNDEPEKIMRSTLNRTYTKDNFTTLDSQLVIGINPIKQYSFRAVLYIVDSIPNEIHYSEIKSFTGAPPPTGIVNDPVISGYIAPDFKTENGIGREGFKVILNEGVAETTTYKDGFFSFDVANSQTVYYKIKIVKPGFIERTIEYGYLSSNNPINQNGPYTIMLCGDINQDNSINMNDIMEIASSFNTSSGNERFKKVADLNEDNSVNMSDVMLAAKNFNKSSAYYPELANIPYIELKSNTKNIYPLFAYRDQTIDIDLTAYNVNNLGGYAVNISYNPQILEPIDDSGVLYRESTKPAAGDMLNNLEYTPFAIAKNDLVLGTMHFGKAYLNLPNYKDSGKGETSGTLAKIKFKVIGNNLTANNIISFSTTKYMPDNNYGVQLFDWNGEEIKEFEIIQPRISVMNAMP